MLNQTQKEWLKIASEVFEVAGCAPLYLVGGFVRDLLLARPSDDVDLAVPTQPAQLIAVSQQFAQTVNRVKNGWRATFLTLDPENGVTRVVFQKAPQAVTTEATAEDLLYFDFAAFGTATRVEEDLARRDFTINALAIELKGFLANPDQNLESMVLDVSGGLADLHNKVVRAVSEQNLIDDPLRMLRGVRLKAQLSNAQQAWHLETQTLAYFTKHASLITQPAPERTREELNKLLMAADTERNLRLLDTTGILTKLIPELEEGRTCTQGSAHYYTVLDHSLATVDRTEWLTTTSANFFGLGQASMQEAARPETLIRDWPEILADLEADGKAKLLILCWAALLHDIAKPRTKQTDASGKLSFYEHNRIGAEMSRAILQHLRFSNTQVEQISSMVQHHLRIGQLGENVRPPDFSSITDRAVFRFLRDTEPVQAGMLVLSLADHAAVDGPRLTQPRNSQGWVRHLYLTDFFARKCWGAEPERVIGKPRLLDGKLLMRELKLAPGPKVGYLLRQLEEAQAASEISTTAEALALAAQLLAQPQTDIN
jgi:putative nucleotidyltransferase with HDIG domain